MRNAVFFFLLLAGSLPAEELGELETGLTRATRARQEEKLDPARDGWDTEAFAQAAQDRLNDLGSLLGEPERLTPGSLRELTVAKATAPPLLPRGQMKEVYTSSDFTVTRLHDPTLLKAVSLTAGHLRSLAEIFKSPRFKFKIFKVNRLDADRIETRQFLALSDEQRELNATWSIVWESATTRIRSIELEECELVTRPRPGTLFTDATGSWLEDREDLRDHLGHGINHWQDRIEKLLSMHFFGHNGLAVGDVNGDGLDDLYLCQAAAVPNKLFLQQADGTTREVAAAAGVDLLNASRGCLLVDLDNDADQDLVLTTPYTTLIMLNDGSGRFSFHQNIEAAGGGYSLSAVDYDHDGDLDLYVCVYYQKPAEARALAYPVPYHDANNGGRNILLRNDELNFVDATAEVGLDAENHRFSFAASWEDFDTDGDLDLYVANDYGRNHLYRNQLTENGRATFVSDAATYGIEDTSFGMSVAWGDADGDGLIDLYTGNMFSGAGNRIAFQDRFQKHAPGTIKAKLQRTARGNSLFLNTRDGRFKDVTMSSGAHQGRWAWGSIFADLNNDGREDLVVGNGFVTGKKEDDL